MNEMFHRRLLQDWHRPGARYFITGIR